MRAIFTSLSCACALLAQRPAEAADAARASARLELEKGPGGAQCIDARALKRAVELRLQRPAFRPDLPATLNLQIAIERKPDASWDAEIVMRDSSGAVLGTRSIATRAAHCSALDDSLALVVALLVDAPPGAATGADHQPERATSPPARAPVTPAKTPTITLPRDTPAPRQPWLFELTLEGTAAIGLLPGVAPGVELGVGGTAPALPEIRIFSGLYPERQEQRAGANAGARFSFVNVGLELCPLDRALGAVHWIGCAGQTLGWLRVAAFGFDENTTTTHLSYTLLAWTGLTIPVAKSLAGRLGVRAELPLERGTFSYGTRAGGQRDLFETKPVAAVLDLGLIVRL